MPHEGAPRSGHRGTSSTRVPPACLAFVRSAVLAIIAARIAVTFASSLRGKRPALERKQVSRGLGEDLRLWLLGFFLSRGREKESESDEYTVHYAIL